MECFSLHDVLHFFLASTAHCIFLCNTVLLCQLIILSYKRIDHLKKKSYDCIYLAWLTENVVQ